MLLKNADKAAMIWGDRIIAYRSLTASIDAYAQRLDIQPGERVALFSENRPEWIYALYAVWKKGAIAAPMDSLSTAEEVAYMLNDCRPAVVFCSRACEDVLRTALAASVPCRVEVFENQPDPASGPTGEGVPLMPGGRTALIMYTSGTTGNPKGVMLSFDNLMANIEAVSRQVPIFTPEDIILGLLPLHHILPLMGCVVIPLYVGASTCFASPLAPENLVRAMRESRVTIIIGVPRFYSMIRKGIMEKINARGITRLLFRAAARAGSRGFSRLVFGAVHRKFGGRVKHLVSGGAALDPAVARDLWTLGFEVLEGFGMTEAAPMITFPRPGHARLGSTGQALPGQQVRIVEGEIAASGPNIMQGYYNRPAETAEVLRDGWLFTGDLGYMDEDGYLFITGRKKEILVLPTGKKINPAEVESRILGLSPLVKEAGVFFGDGILQAVLVPDAALEANRTAAEIEDHIRWQILDAYNRAASPAKRIQHFTVIRKELPKTRMGKLKRHKLESLAEPAGTRTASAPEPATPEYAALRDFLRRELERPVFPNDHLEMDAGLDSLGKVGLQVFLRQTFGVELDDRVMAEYPTVARLSEFIAHSKTRAGEAGSVQWGDILDGPADADLPRAWITMNLIQWVAWLGLKAFFRVKATGLDKLPAAPFILAPNHQSYLDGLFVTIFLKGRQLRETYFYGKKKHIHGRFRTFLAQHNNTIVVDSEKNLVSSLQKLAAVLRKKQNLIIFPEGTRTRDGLLGEFRKTFAILSRELNVPVIPVAISGAFAALPPGSRFPRPFTSVTVRFLDPCYPAGKTVEEVMEQIRQDVAGAIY